MVDPRLWIRGSTRVVETEMISPVEKLELGIEILDTASGSQAKKIARVRIQFSTVPMCGDENEMG